MSALYNENDPYAARWMRALIDEGHIANGVVDERSIEELKPADVAGPGQRHFFAGIGGWSYALRLAGIADDADVWTGSCPCQPFSDAGTRQGVGDARHLWPAWFALVEKCRPPILFGEQVASRAGLRWLDIVLADLERCGYAIGATDLCAAGVGAPHIRQRLYFVAYRDPGRRPAIRAAHDVDGNHAPGNDARRRGAIGPIVMGDAGGEGSGRYPGTISVAQAQGKGERLVARGERDESVDASALGVADSAGGRRRGRVTNGGWSPWGDASRDHEGLEWIDCTDGKRRPIKPGIKPLADGVPGRVGALSGSGNAIVPQLAAVFVRTALDALGSVEWPG